MTLVYVAAAWVSGIVLTRALDLSWPGIAFVGLVGFIALLLGWEDDQVRLTGVLVLTTALGGARLQLAMPSFDETSLAAYNGVGLVTLEGTVVGEPDERDRHTNLRLRTDRIVLADGTEREVSGLVLIRAGRHPRRECGDRLRVEGLLKAPPVYEGFSYRDYLARQGVYSMMRWARIDALERRGGRPLLFYLLAVKRRAQRAIARMLPEPQASLLTGILLGVEGGIPERLMDAFEATGTSHIIVISGFNITIVSALFAGTAGRLLHRRFALVAAILAVALYAILVGAGPAVIRAALMGDLYLLSHFFGRRSYPPVTLATASIAMTVWNPQALWDAGFMLSFLATAGLLFFTRPLESLAEQVIERVAPTDWAQRIVGLISEGVLVTMASMIGTVPLLLSYFGQLSPVTLLSNLLILPAQPYIMTIGGAATLLGMVAEPLGRVVGWVVWVFLTYTIEVVRWTAHLPVGVWRGELPNWAPWAYYATLALTTWWCVTPAERRHEVLGRVWRWITAHVETKMLFGVSGILLVLAFFAWKELPDGRLHVHFLDVGQGDAILVETPSGRQVLVDGGPSPSAVLSQLGRRLPFWDRTLDVVVLTHPDDDHITGLVEVLDRYEVEIALFREVGCEEAICHRWDRLLDEKEIAVHQAELGLGVELEDGVRLEVLHPGANLTAGEGFNNNSVVVRLTHGKISVLLTGDIETAPERALLERGDSLRSSVLKVAHHGACGSSSFGFLEAADPEVAVISVGADNDFGHPCDDVLARLTEVVGGANREPLVFRTDRDGSVEVVTDGTQLWIHTERERWIRQGVPADRLGGRGDAE